ncbi:hypothetical protein [Candidatus Nitrosocosmicus sp. T]
MVIDSNGIEYSVTFAGKSGGYDQFLPVAEYMISTITFDKAKVAEALEIDLSPVNQSPTNSNLTNPGSELPEIPTN